MNTSTLDKLRKLKFYGMFHAFKSSIETGQTDQYTSDELLTHLIDSEWDYRQNRRIERQILYAKFRYKASIEEIHYHADRSIDRNQVMRLATVLFLIDMKICSLLAVLVLGKVIWPRQSAIRHACWVTEYYTPARQNFLLNLKWLRQMDLISRRLQKSKTTAIDIRRFRHTAV